MLCKEFSRLKWDLDVLERNEVEKNYVCSEFSRKDCSAWHLAWPLLKKPSARTLKSPVSHIPGKYHSPLNADASALWIAYMNTQLLGCSLMEISQCACHRKVQSGLYQQSIGSHCKIKDQRYCVLVRGQENHSKWQSPSIIHDHQLGVLVTVESWSCHYWGSYRDVGADAGQQEQPGHSGLRPSRANFMIFKFCLFLSQILFL